MQSEIKENNCRELIFQRMLTAVISSIILQFILLSFIAVLINIMNIVASPLSSIESIWTLFTSVKVWCYLMVVVLMVTLEINISTKNYVNPPAVYHNSRFTMFCKLFTPYNLINGAIYVISGLSFILVYLSMQNSELHSNSLFKNCTKIHGTCLNENYLFLLIGGLWTGIHFYIKSNIFGLNSVIKFPIISESKIPQIIRGIKNILTSSVTNAVWLTIYYIVVYYLFGTYIRVITMSIIYSLRIEDEPLDTIWGLFNLSLICNLWLFITLFGITINSMHLTFQVYLTQWMKFQVGPSIYNTNNENTKVITLSDALAMKRVPIIQHLGYLDLVMLAQKEKYRRSHLFKLSQPGGHPYNWNSIIEQCLLLIREFSDEIVNPAPVSSAISKEQNIKELPSTSEAIQSSFEKPSISMLGKMRNLSNNSATTAAPIPSIIVTQHETSSLIGWQFINEFIKTTKLNITTYLLSKPLIFYLFGTPTDSKMQYLLINGQSIIWAADSISSLAVASLEEDPYGIVQKDLPAIITALFCLKQSLDKYYKINLLTRKPQHEDKQVRQMLSSLKVASKRSIYRITTAFKNYIDDLVLDQSLKDQLISFFLCKE